VDRPALPESFAKYMSLVILFVAKTHQHEKLIYLFVRCRRSRKVWAEYPCAIGMPVPVRSVARKNPSCAVFDD
jgi:hypothetical protein